MSGLVFVQELKVGDLLTAGSVLVGTGTLLYALLKDRRLRRREYADKIRRSASDSLAALERWREIAIRHFYDAQPLLTDADLMIVTEQNVVKTRDALWRELMQLEVQTSARVLSEKLEGAYAGLYGYDPTIQETYSQATNLMKDCFEDAHYALLSLTQQDVVSMELEEKPYFSAQLGNRLRQSTAKVKAEFSERASEALRPLREQMLALVVSGDDALFKKSVHAAHQTFPNVFVISASLKRCCPK